LPPWLRLWFRKILRGKMFDIRRIPLLCSEKRLSKHKMTIFSKNLGGMAPPGGKASGAHRGSMAPWARSKFGALMFEPDVCRKQMYCTEECTCGVVGTVRHPHAVVPIVIRRPVSCAPFAPLSLRPCIAWTTNVRLSNSNQKTRQSAFT